MKPNVAESHKVLQTLQFRFDSDIIKLAVLALSFFFFPAKYKEHNFFLPTFWTFKGAKTIFAMTKSNPTHQQNVLCNYFTCLGRTFGKGFRRGLDKPSFYGRSNGPIRFFHCQLVTAHSFLQLVCSHTTQMEGRK